MMPSALKRLFGFEDRFAKRAALRTRLRRYRPQLEAMEDRVVPAVTIVTPLHPAGWTPTATDASFNPDDPAPPPPSSQYVSGPAAPPLGDGSIELAVGPNGDASAQLRNADYDGTLLGDLTALGYSTYVQQDGSGGQAP